MSSATPTRNPTPLGPTSTTSVGSANAQASVDPNAPCPLNPRPDPSRGASTYPSATIPRDVPLPWNNQSFAPTAFNITGCLTSFSAHPMYPKHIEWLCPNAAGNGSFSTGYVLGWVQAHADRTDRFLAIDDPAYYLASNVGGKQWDQDCTFPLDPLGMTWPQRNLQCAGCPLGYSLTASNLTFGTEKQWYLHGCLSVKDDRGHVQQACSWLDLPVGAWCLHPERTQRMAKSMFACEKDGKSDIGLVSELLRGLPLESKQEEQGDWSLAVKIGVGVGASLVLIAVLAFSFFIYRQRRLAGSRRHAPVPQSPQDAPNTQDSTAVDMLSQPVPAVAMPQPRPPMREQSRMSYVPVAPHDLPFFIGAMAAQAKKDDDVTPQRTPTTASTGFVFSPAPAHLQMPPQPTVSPSQVNIRPTEDDDLILAPPPSPSRRYSRSEY